MWYNMKEMKGNNAVTWRGQNRKKECPSVVGELGGLQSKALLLGGSATGQPQFGSSSLGQA